MKNAYPIILTQVKEGFVVYIPDFDIGTQGENLTDAIEMARDAIGITGIDFEDDGKEIPSPSSITEHTVKDGETLSLVDVDFYEYRRMNDMRSVKKNCTIPAWLCARAESEGINFSLVLQNALKSILGVAEPQLEYGLTGRRIENKVDKLTNLTMKNIELNQLYAANRPVEWAMVDSGEEKK